jgi:hypothetical protein
MRCDGHAHRNTHQYRKRSLNSSARSGLFLPSLRRIVLIHGWTLLCAIALLVLLFRVTLQPQWQVRWKVVWKLPHSRGQSHSSQFTSGLRLSCRRARFPFVSLRSVVLDLGVQTLTLLLHFGAFLVPVNQIGTEEIEFAV